MSIWEGGEQLFFNDDGKEHLDNVSDEKSVSKSVEAKKTAQNEEYDIELNKAPPKRPKWRPAVQKKHPVLSKAPVGAKFISRFEKQAQERANQRAKVALKEKRKARKHWNEQHKDGAEFGNSGPSREAQDMERWGQYSALGAKPPAQGGFLRLRGQAGGTGRPQSQFPGAHPATRTRTKQPSSVLHRQPNQTRSGTKPNTTNQPKRYTSERPQESRFNQVRREQFAQRDYEALHNNSTQSRTGEHQWTQRPVDQLSMEISASGIPDPLNLFQLRSIGTQTEGPSGSPPPFSGSSPATMILKTLAHRPRKRPAHLCTRATSPFSEERLRSIFRTPDLQPQQVGGSPRVPQDIPTTNQTPSETHAQTQLLSEMTKMMKAVAELVHGHSTSAKSDQLPQGESPRSSVKTSNESRSRRTNSSSSNNSNRTRRQKKAATTPPTKKKKNKSHWSQLEIPKPLLFVNQNDHDFETLCSPSSRADHVLSDTTMKDGIQSPDGSPKLKSPEKSDDSTGEGSSAQSCDSPVEPSSKIDKTDVLERLLQKLDDLEIVQKHFEQQENIPSPDELSVADIPEEPDPPDREGNADECLPLGVLLAAADRLIQPVSYKREEEGNVKMEFPFEPDKVSQSTNCGSGEVLPPSWFDISIGEEKLKEISANVTKFERHRSFLEMSLQGSGVSFAELIDILSEDLFQFILEGMETEYEQFFQQYAERLLNSI